MTVAKLLVLFSSLFAFLTIVVGHGKMIDPINRSTLWRHDQFKKLIAENVQDNENFCGGFPVQYSPENAGKCGVCGDNYADPVPRKNENGGTYGKGLIAASYKVGEKIKAKVDLTANHRRYFKFSICHLVDPAAPETEECFDKYPLKLIDNKGETADKYYVGTMEGEITIELFLPKDLACERCVLRWHYTVGNNWGFCDEAMTMGDLGCGDQETFRSCADVAINSES